MIRNILTYTPHILPTILLLSEESLSGLTSFLTILFLRTTCLWSPTSCCCPCCWCHCSRLPRSPEHHWRPPKTVVDHCWIALWWELQLFAHLSWTFFSTILFSSECIRSQEASGDVFDLTWPFYKKIFYWLYSKINVYLFFLGGIAVTPNFYLANGGNFVNIFFPSHLELELASSLKKKNKLTLQLVYLIIRFCIDLFYYFNYVFHHLSVGLEPEDVTISFPIILFVNSFNNTLQSVCWEKN